MRQIFSTYPIEAVIHLAAFAYVGESVTDPQKYYFNNVVNTLNLLQIMLEFNIKKIIFSSSCATYGNPITVPISENNPQAPINSYGLSKLMVEQILDSYFKAYDMKYVILRYFNASGADIDVEIGENHNPETHLIPLVLDAAMGIKDHVCIFGTDYDTFDGTAIRDYIHVTDIAIAHVLALDYLTIKSKPNVFNLGNGEGYSVQEVISTAKKVTNSEIKILAMDRREGDPAILIGSATKARELLGWSPKYPSIEIIMETAWKWHLKLKGNNNNAVKFNKK